MKNKKAECNPESDIRFKLFAILSKWLAEKNYPSNVAIHFWRKIEPAISEIERMDELVREGFLSPSLLSLPSSSSPSPSSPSPSFPPEPPLLTPTPLSPSPTPSPLPFNPTHNLSKRTSISTSSTEKDADDFETFWKEYPRKDAKQPARKKWMTKNPPMDKVMAALRKQKQSWNDPKYIPMASTWLNQERWNDEGVTLPSEEDDVKVDKFDGYGPLSHSERSYLLDGCLDDFIEYDGITVTRKDALERRRHIWKQISHTLESIRGRDDR